MYAIDLRAQAILAHEDTELRAKLTTWIIDQHRSGIRMPTIDSGVVQLVRNRRRLRISEKKKRFFELLLANHFQLGDEFDFLGDESRDYANQICAWTECENDEQLSGLFRLFRDEGILATGEVQTSLTPLGYKSLEDAEIGGADTRRVFVAMWFDQSMNSAYDDGIAPAIREAGYEPIRIDKKEHSNRIDDEIIAEIKRSRFVVADFTCDLRPEGDLKLAIARGGVYYEAGYAQGLGTPVIWMARNDCIGHVHFDTRQFSHIVWGTPADLKTKLRARIAAVVGEIAL